MINLNFSILNIDKPTGPTSFQISQYIKDQLKISKTSHFGTLDPKVTGVLPVALGRACRLNEFFMHSNKTYVGIMRVHNKIEEEKIKETVKKFIGKIKQVPPVRSSVKRQERERTVYSFKILEIKEKDILFETKVQAGTYIRKLCDDIGKEIGGAHMLELRRIQASVFSESDENFINLYDFDKAVEENELDKVLIPAEEAIKKVLPIIQFEKDISLLLTGKPLHKGDIKETPETFALFQKDKFIGIYKSTREKDIIAKPIFVYN
jgi:H/ACA ribonucleoprotein complex subunit 4